MVSTEKILVVAGVLVAVLIVAGVLVWIAYEALKSWWHPSGAGSEPKRSQPESRDSAAEQRLENQFPLRLSELERRLNRLETWLKQLDSEMKVRLGQQPQPESPPPSPEVKDEAAPEVAETPFVLPSKTDLEGFRDAYNAVIAGKVDRGTFREFFRPVRVGVANVVERGRDSGIEPIYRSANDGDYLAVELMIDGEKRFAVVPRFDLTFQETSYGPGAMGQVFDCHGYDSERKYHDVTVRKLAFFVRVSGDDWGLTHKGELDLGQAE